MDYVSASAFKMGNCFIRIETKKFDYADNKSDLMCKKGLLIIVERNLFEPAFQFLSRFPIPTPNAPVTLKTKQNNLSLPGSAYQNSKSL